MASWGPRSPDWLRVGTVVELRSDEPGYSGAWFMVEIMQLLPARNEAVVEYLDFVEAEVPGAKRTQEFAKVDNLRPVPPELPVPKQWHKRDAVETLHCDAWWVGYIKDWGPKPRTYRIYYGHGQTDLDIAADRIRPRQTFDRPTADHPNGTWSMAPAMQNPAVWESAVVTPRKKTTVVKSTGAKRTAGQIEPRWKAPAPDVGAESDDSWDVRDERRQKAKKRSKSAPAKSEAGAKRRIRIMPFDKRDKRMTITHAIPAINPPPRVAEQSTLVLTPGSSPPLADSPVQDSDSHGQRRTDSRATRVSSHSSRGESSGTSTSSSSGSDNEEEEEEDDNNNSSGDGEENVSIHGRMSSGLPDQIFQGFPTDSRAIDNIEVYHQLLVCFRNSDKGSIDEARRQILRGIKEELKLSRKQCDQVHCHVFGMPFAYW